MAGERILVVDDGQESRDFIVDYILKPNQFEPLLARNGLEGLELARQHHPDLILLDLQMPKMNGMEVLDAMNAEGLNIPVILMTFHGSEEIAVEVYRKGVRDYVKKPYTVDEMLGAIERSMGEVRLRKEKEALTERLITANKDLNQRIRELNTLYHVGKSVTALVELDELLSRVVRAAIEITGSDEGSIHLLENDTAICRARKSGREPQVEVMHEPSNDPFVRQVVRTTQPLLLNPKEMQPHRQKNPQLPATVLYVPMIVADRVIGALGVARGDAERDFRKQDSAMLTALADYAAIAIENSRNFSRISGRQQADQGRFRQILERFLQPQSINRLLDEPDNVSLPTVQTAASVLCVSLQGFPSLLNRLDTRQLSDIVNRYANIMQSIVDEQGGTVSHYLAEGLLAFFDMTSDSENYVYLAAETALRLRDTLQEASRRLDFDVQPSLGVYAGDVVVGNLGVLRGLNLSVMGRPVDVAQYLEYIARPGQVLTTAELIDGLGNQVQWTYLGEVEMRNQPAPLKVYDLLSIS
jgi:class 3 adenylate cyclase/DNA-binding response OmpR family regulator